MAEDDRDVDDPKDVERFNQLARRMEQMEELRGAIGGFLADFALFETASLTFALSALSSDHVLVEYLPELMDLSKRLKLLKLLGAAHRLPQQLQDDIAHVRTIANDLLECRNDIAHGVSALFGSFLEDENAPLTPGVQRRRSQRAVPRGPLTVEQVAALNKDWIHDLPTIRKWTEIAQQLQRSTHQLAHKLGYYTRGEPWEKSIVTRVDKPLKSKAGS